MAETDILNPVRTWWDVLGDNPNWSYGWVRKTSQNKQQARPRLGRRYSRELQNAGYIATLNYIDRPYSTVLWLKRFYEQFQGGYFTLIDYNGYCRHHVGNFTTEPNAVQTAHDKYTIQGLVFEECPQARMLTYPNDFERSSHNVYTVDDYLSPLVATQGNGWNPQLSPAMAGTSLYVPSSYEMFSAAPAAGDFAQIEYVGWGFQATFRQGLELGLCDLYVDGVLFCSGLDPSVENPQNLADGTTTAIVEGGIQIQKLNMPLDKHRIKLVARAAAGAASTANGMAFPAIQVMH